VIIDHSNYGTDYDAREPKVKPKLTDVGTRFDHLSELLSYWNDGIETIKASLKTCRNDKDIGRLAGLGAAVYYLESRLEILAGWDDKQFALARELQDAGLNPNNIIKPKPKPSEGTDPVQK
jgi:hypothetical protein